MKTESGMPALGLLLVVALAGAIFVPVVSAESENNLNENFSSGGDIVGIDTQLKRSPYLLDEEGDRLSDTEISEMIEKMPKVTYLDGMTETESKKISEILNQLHKYRSISESMDKANSLKTVQVQADAGARIDDYHYNGINGNNHPGYLEVSSDGTVCHYLTSHIGKKISGVDTWIEVGVAKISSAIVGGDPSKYVVYTYDSTAYGDEKYIAHRTFTSGFRDYNFEIYISTSSTSEGYPYILSWQGSVIRTGYVPFCYGDVDENHEYFAFDGNTFNSVSESYLCDSYLFTSYNSNTLWWNGNIPDFTKKHLTTDCSAGTPQLEYPFLVPWWSEAYQVKSWIP
ncbi:hypothetical protein [Methanolacinia paynteri]|uniref:hypothetical protein n=1 Tax=Methanolacinia paynteri TaxID=230356 RepID=UPI0012F6FDEE|nr:hypothetical protein [Methanolacinia paynteri]